MFIDTGAALKAAKRNNITIFPEVRELLDEIDARQGVRDILRFNKNYPPADRNSAWRIIQLVHPRVIVVESKMAYYYNYKYIVSKDMRKEIKHHTVFCVNYLDEKFLDNLDYTDLREAVKAGNKLVIYGVTPGK